GYYKNSSGEYVKRKKSNQNEKYLDKTNPNHGTVNSSTITTKNFLYDEIKLGNPSLNPYNEVQSNGHFKTYQGGFYEIDLSLTISDLTSEKINYISLTLTEVGGDNKSYKLSEKTSNDVLSTNSLFIKTSGIFELEGNREYRLMLQGSANTGHTFSVSSGDYVIRRVL